MNRLDNLKEIADRQLGGLEPTPALRARIRIAAKEQRREGAKRLGWLPMLSACAAGVVAVYFSVSSLFGAPPAEELLPQAVPQVIDSRPAGENSPGAARALLDLNDNSLSVGGQTEAPAYRSLFAKSSGGNFPLVMVDGKTYRMLKSPSDLKDKYLGDLLGEVSEYTTEPALSSGGVVSNSAAAGASVYAVKGMEGAMAAAEVDGKTRLYQRVSFAGAGAVGGETLADVLCAAENVSSLELSGVGVIGDAAKAAELMGTLLDNAVCQSAGADFGSKQSLIVKLQNGLSLQLMVKDDAVSACGTWSCPEFFEAFAVAMSEE